MREPTRPTAWTTRRGALKLALAMALVACSGASSAADVGGQPVPPEQSAREALEALETTPEQDDQLLALVGKFAIVLSKSGKSRRAFTEELLKSLMLGKVTDKAMDPVRADFEEAIREATPEVLALFNELHGILTPDQRTKLIEGLSARFEASEATRKARNKEMIEELDIGFMQKIEIAQAMSDKMDHLRPKLEKMKLDAKAAGEAFKREKFDATELALFKTDLGKLYLETVVVLVATLGPELEYEQRRALADIIRHRLNGGDKRR